MRVVATKWGDQPHWEYDATWLGTDHHGTWLGVAVGTFFARPGVSFSGEVAQVVLVPGSDAGGAGWWQAAFHDEGFRVATYVDMASPPQWSHDDRGWRVTSVDLDLDVVRLADGTVYVDDEDEFAEHQVAFGYPHAVVQAAENSCTWVHAAVREARAPFDGGHRRWLAQVTDVPAG